MFGRKKKTPIQKARQDLEKQIRVVNKQAKSTRKDLVKRLNHTANDLRSEFEDLLDTSQGKQASRLAKELETMAHDVEKRAEKSLDAVTDTAEDNVWGSVFIAFAVGIIFGLIIKNLME
ncbi:MAG: hypothetical protein Phog2KO_40280 [Phototrophicaceae bacterium]